MKTERLYFKNLDSIRFFAALMVFLAHGIKPSYHYLGMDGTLLMRVLNTISSGGVGVSIFFVLSGFLISYLLISEYEVSGKVALKNFYVRRILRIWPLYYAVVIFSFFIYPFLKSFIGMANHSQSNVLYYLTFLSNFDLIHTEKFFKGQDVSSQNITWSVSVEEQFYLFWPLLFTFLPKRWWVYAISTVIIGSIAFRVYNYDDPNVLYFSTFSVLMDLGIGGLVAYLIKTNQKVKGFFASASTGTHLILFIVSFSMLFWSDQVSTFKYSPALNRIFFSISFAMIIAAQAMTTQDSILNLGRFSFGNKWGKYTYGIYLIHPIALTILDIVTRVTHVSYATNFIGTFAFGVVGFFLTLLMSWVSYEYFESRFLALKEKFAVIKTH
jgi:peptidoglycan/LPS O-acetylase OafA/YrhL